MKNRRTHKMSHLPGFFAVLFSLLFLSTNAFAECVVHPKCKRAQDQALSLVARINSSSGGSSVHETAEKALCIAMAAANADSLCKKEALSEYNDEECAAQYSQMFDAHLQTVGQSEETAIKSYGGSGEYKSNCSKY